MHHHSINCFEGDEYKMKQTTIKSFRCKDSDYYESYDELKKDYAKYMQDEDKKAKKIIEKNKKDIEYLRKKYAR